MTALSTERVSKWESWAQKVFTLTSGTVAYQGGSCVIVTGTGKVVPGTTATGRLAIGTFAESVDASAADADVTVKLHREIIVWWFANATGGDAIAATDVGSLCYIMDDQTVTITATGRTVAGRIWEYSATKGIAVEVLPTITDGLALNRLSYSATLPAFAAGDSAPSSIVSGAVYDVPTTAANSTITLPDSQPDGTIAYFHADGTKNGHTVTYQQGSTALSAAMTASKIHLATAVSLGGVWAVIAQAAP